MIVQNQADRDRLLQAGDTRGEQSLPILRDWLSWWSVWGPRVAAEAGRQPWILFLLDASERIIALQTTLSRLIRSKPEWDTRGWSEDEWSSPENVTARALAWFEQNVPREVPEFAAFIIAGQRGTFQTLARLGKEIRRLQEAGYNTVVVQADDATDMRVIRGGDALLKEIEA